MLQFFLITGVVCIIISGLFIGAWTDGQQQRANFHSESVNHRNFRTKIAFYAGIAGGVSLSIAALIYFFIVD
ncbi:DUF5316 family protein [Cytobacillus dafuensis]|uniref:Uncharacterized protein n=1 Tax=Cytobacillus dafuensis TaxID=1742359 RepID=A0A5B8Z2W9_CYTDA|nr:DUF5316 family protein [Cytobacillus dafuensis]QED46593.1 hypothetical protein FSZ17_04485 [Cytobacillus dafuensis]